MISARPITSRLSARLRHIRPFDDAVEMIEVDGPTEWHVEPIIALPDEAERVVAHHPYSSPELNNALLTSSSFTQGPCRMHRVQDAIIADGTVLTKRSYEPIQARDRRAILRGEPQAITEAVMCSTSVTERFFAHWLHDGLTHELLAEARGMRRVTLAGGSWPNQPGYRELVDLPACPVSFATVKDLWLLEDWELSRNRAGRLIELGRRVRAGVPDGGPANVFIARGKLGVGRTLVNEAEVIDALNRRGFAILRPEELEPKEIVRTLKNARLVVSVEGSANGHALLAAPSTSGFIAIMGPRHLNMHLRRYLGIRDIRFGYTVGDLVDGESFTQPIDRLLKTIDLLDSALV
jgi:hypothetical protein